MQPGYDRIIACPHCSGLARHHVLASGNTFGARVWTDGKQIAPMLPRPPAVVQCRHCSEVFWLTDGTEVGRLQPWQEEGTRNDPAWSDAQEVEEPDEERYYRALEKGVAKDREQMKFLRILAWWRRNDAFRDDTSAESDTEVHLSLECKRNLHALADLLLETDDNECIMKAEVLRELGEFYSAKALLAPMADGEYRTVVQQLQELCAAEDQRVRELRVEW
jgi:hypothetical protein